MLAIAQGADQSFFLIGRDAAEDGRLQRGLLELEVVQTSQLGAGDHTHRGTIPVQTGLPGDGGDGLWIVAGDDLELDARPGEAVQGLAGLGPEFIAEVEQAQGHQPGRQPRLVSLVVQRKRFRAISEE